jgi:hypothetical protein
MVFIKILGGIDLLGAIAFLMLVFGLDPVLQYTLFCAGLLFMKGMFVFSGDVLSLIDLFSSFILLLSILFAVPIVLLWIAAFLLFAKGIVSFL